MQLANIKLISQHHFLVRGQAKTTCPEPIVLKRKKSVCKINKPSLSSQLTGDCPARLAG